MVTASEPGSSDVIVDPVVEVSAGTSTADAGMSGGVSPG